MIVLPTDRIGCPLISFYMEEEAQQNLLFSGKKCEMHNGRLVLRRKP